MTLLAGVSALGAMVLTALPASADPATPEPDTTVVPDAAFQACLNVYLTQPDGASITAAQLEGLATQSVQCVNRGIVSITGAEYLTGALNLDLSSNLISDISPLKGLTGLEALNLAGDPISSIEPLAGLASLTNLRIDNTQVADLTPIARLANLQELTLGTLPTNDVTSPASVRGLAYGSDMTSLTLTTQVGSWVTLPGANFVCPWGVPCPPGLPARTWSVQSGGANIDSTTNTAMLTSSGTTVLTWTDPDSETGGSGTLTITASVSCNGFTDVSVSDWFYDPVCWLTDNGLTKGSNPAGTMFSPNVAVTRGQMAAFLYRVAGSPTVTLPATSPFTDVATTNGFYKEIVWLQQQKITTGTNPAGTLFSPDNAVTRGQMAAFMYRLTGSPAVTLPAKSPFTDVATTNGFYKEIVWLQQQKITTGTNPAGTLFSPNDAVTRGQVAAFLQRLATTKLPCATYTDAIGC